MGWIGGKSIVLDNISVNLENKIGAVAVQALDNVTLDQSGNILISFASRTEPLEPRQLPFYSEPLQGQVKIRAKSGLKLYLLDPMGEETEIPVEYQQGEYLFTLGENTNSYWFSLK